MKRLFALAVVVSLFGLSTAAFAANPTAPCCGPHATHGAHFNDLSWDR